MPKSDPAPEPVRDHFVPGETPPMTEAEAEVWWTENPPAEEVAPEVPPDQPPDVPAVASSEAPQDAGLLDV